MSKGMVAVLLASLALPATAQSLPVDPSTPDHPLAETQSEGLEEVGRTADTGIGEVGERTEGVTNREPLGRLESRIPNRIQNRIRNRLDRFYDPMANANEPFKRADQQTRRKGLGAPQ